MSQTERIHLGASGVFALSKAAKLLPLRDSDARGWLRQKGLVLNLEGREVVVWGDVVEALRAHDITPPTSR